MDKNNLKTQLDEFLRLHRGTGVVLRAEEGREAFDKIAGIYKSKINSARSAEQRGKYAKALGNLQSVYNSGTEGRRRLYSFCRDIVRLGSRSSYVVVSDSFGYSDDKDKVAFSEKELEKFLAQELSETSFSDLVNEYMLKKNMSPRDVYTNANLSRQDFSRITTPGRGVKRTTVYSVAIGLRLNWTETQSLLTSAGYAFRSDSLFDLIIKFCITKRQYDVGAINEALYSYGQNTLATNGYIRVID